MLPRPNKRWVIHERIPQEVDDSLSRYPAFFRQILYSRGIQDEIQARFFLDCTEEPGSPFQLDGMEDTVNRLLWAARRGEPVVVYGDYDVDGVTATALLVQVLRRYGADVTPYIPNRYEEGYGLNVEALKTLHDQGAQVVITVDCGIRSLEEVAYARTIDLDLIVSDHHHPGSELPDAYAVICPKREGCRYPFMDLSGVGIAYKIAQALEERCPEAGVSADEWLDLVALGTVADIVPLKGENRVLVRKGLQKLRQGARPGLASLAAVAGVKTPRITAGDIGFMLGPRLNASGRLDTAMNSLNLLLASDFAETGLLAQQLDNQNRERQEKTRRIQEEAIRMSGAAEAAEILFAFDPSFSSGIVGLAASRLVDAFYRPAIVGEQGPEFTRASCRSIPEFHITRALDEVSDLLVRHGGHALAAGFTVRTEHLPVLIERLRAIAQRELGDKDLQPELRADLELPLSELHPGFLPYLDLLQPTGQSNSEAIFVSRDVRVVRARPVGADNHHLKLSLTDGKIIYDAIAFRQGHRAEKLPERLDVMYLFEKNEFNGRESLQLNIRDLKPAGKDQWE